MELHIIFFILAAVLLLVLVGYSVWSARREKSRVFSNSFSQRAQPALQEDAPSIVPSFAQNADLPPVNEPQVNESQIAQEVAQEVERSLNNIKISLGGQEATYQSAPTSPQSTPIFQEPVAQAPAPQQAAEEPQNTETQTLQLYVVAPEGMKFSGEMIVHKLEELGLHYDSEYQIFQRHIDTAASPVLFGVANMMNPGIFDLNTIHRFQTMGLVLFMNVPSLGNDQANLRLMISTAENLAQSLGGFVWDENCQLFDDQARLNYLQRV